MNLLASLSHLIDQRVPAHLSDPDAQRRARLVLWFALILATQVVGFSILYLFLGAPLVALIVGSVGLTLSTTPWVLRRASLSLTASWLALQATVVLDTISWFTGGLHAPALAWTVIAPVLATMLSNRRNGAVWLAVTCVNATAFYAVTATGHAPPTVLAPAMATLLAVVGLAGLAFVVYAISASYESNTERMMASLDGANGEMRHLLDNVAEGYVTAGASGQASAHHTRILDIWFGPTPPGAPFWAWLGREHAAFRAAAELSWPDLFDDVMPVEVIIDNLPRQLRAGRRVFTVAYRPLRDARGAVDQVIISVSDVTAQVVADRAERSMRERAMLLERLSADRHGFLTFFDEAEQLLASLGAGDPRPLAALHTLKGITALYGCDSVAQLCHALESRLCESDEPFGPADLDELTAAWQGATARVSRLLSEERGRLTVKHAEVEQLVRDLHAGADASSLAARIEAWRHLPTRDLFVRLAEQASALASRLGKGTPRIEVEDHGLRLDPAAWQSLFASLVHLARNAVDHGFESELERVAAGKPAQPLLRFVSRREGAEVVIEISDDGRGVDWERVRERATSLGFAAGTPEELTRALLTERFSTADTVTDVSGRGVGMTAVARACAALGGTLEVESSRRGGGTAVRLRCPALPGGRRAAA